jgi:hypothetical protein
LNLGGEPERDDSGLPPVDIEVPDDARELDRDVQAYHREQRALRRRQRRLRLHAPLTRDGVVLPLLASCLVLALIAGTLLTVFTAGPGDGLPGAAGTPTPATKTSPPASQASANSSPASGRAGASGPAASGASGRASGTTTAAASGANAEPVIPVPTDHRLPSAAVQIDGSAVQLTSLVATVLALVPVGCACGREVSRLAGQAHAAGLKFYLVGGTGLTSFRPLAASAPATAVATDDTTGALARAFPPAGLTALLVGQNGSVSEASGLQHRPDFTLGPALRQLNAGAASAAASGPITSAPASSPAH